MRFYGLFVYLLVHKRARAHIKLSSYFFNGSKIKVTLQFILYFLLIATFLNVQSLFAEILKFNEREKNVNH